MKIKLLENPNIEKPFRKELKNNESVHILDIRDEIEKHVLAIVWYTSLIHFYNKK